MDILSGVVISPEDQSHPFYSISHFGESFSRKLILASLSIPNNPVSRPRISVLYNESERMKQCTHLLSH